MADNLQVNKQKMGELSMENEAINTYLVGFPYPVGLYDKSKHGMNVCVFCGARNSASNNTCEKCGKLMLI